MTFVFIPFTLRTFVLRTHYVYTRTYNAVSDGNDVIRLANSFQRFYVVIVKKNRPGNGRIIMFERNEKPNASKLYDRNAERSLEYNIIDKHLSS